VFIQSSLFIKSSEYLCEITTGETRVEGEWRGTERKKESSGLTEREVEQWTEMEMAWAISENGHLSIF
jgi:hypothetical protein